MEEIQKYINHNKEILENILEYIDNENSSSDDFKKMINLIHNGEDEVKPEALRQLLQLLTSISMNHQRTPNFYIKIQQIIQYFKNQIEQTFSNFDLFTIFKNDNRLLFYLLEQKMVRSDADTYRFFLKESSSNGFKNRYRFYPALKQTLGKKKCKKINKELMTLNLTISFEENIRKGENPSKICTLIRSDSIEDFIIYMNEQNIEPTSKINKSIYESNLFLIENEPSLIEYSAFFGSIRIFEYLLSKNADLNEKIYLYAIHGRNPEIIQRIEGIYKFDKKYLKESIKCFHNELTNYFINNYSIFDDYSEFSYSCNNFCFFPSKLTCNKLIPLYLCKYNYNYLLKLYLEDNKLIYENNDTFTSCISAATMNQNNEIFKFLLNYKKIDFLITNYFIKSNLVSITIPSSIRSIKKNCFDGFNNLKQVKFEYPSSLKIIEGYSFSNCKFLSQIKIPSSVTHIGQFCFSRCISLPEIKFESKSFLTIIDDRIFYNCTFLKKITIPSFVTKIGCYAFFNTMLKKIKFEQPCNLNTIEISCFESCKELEEIDIPSSVTSIKVSAFCNCEKLKRISIPSSVTYIGPSVFSNCCQLEKIELPSSIKKIKKYTFSGCSKLDQVIIPSSVTKIGDYAFEKCRSLKEIVIPSSVTKIKCCTFHDCTSLRQMTVPSSLYIGQLGNNENIQIKFL